MGDLGQEAALRQVFVKSTLAVLAQVLLPTEEGAWLPDSVNSALQGVLAFSAGVAWYRYTTIKRVRSTVSDAEAKALSERLGNL